MNISSKSNLNKNIKHIEGFKFITFNAKVKEKSVRDDFLIIIMDDRSKVSAVFTKNKYCAAPVLIAKKNLKNSTKLLVINSGNANAGTGKKGEQDVEKINHKLATLFSIKPSQVLPFSTGVILQPMPVARIMKSFEKYLTKPFLFKSDWLDAAKAIMTTDTIPKAISKTFNIDGHKISCTGIAKGSGMINPNMATMLAFIMLDVSISQKMLNELIKQVVAKSFNLITVDGDTSTNDSLVIASSNKAANEVIKTKNKYYFELEKHLIAIAKTLAQAIVRDGEGATKFVEIEIKNAKNIYEVSTVGKVIANSPLVKTAFFASDPNLGRILAAIGNVGSINFDPGKIDIKLNNSIVIRNGQLAKSYSEEKAFLAMKKKEFKLSINLKRGSVTESVFTTDFSYDYVKINAEYRS